MIWKNEEERCCGVKVQSKRVGDVLVLMCAKCHRWQLSGSRKAMQEYYLRTKGKKVA